MIAPEKQPGTRAGKTDAVMAFAQRRRTAFASLVPALLWIGTLAAGGPTRTGLLLGCLLIIIGQAIRLWAAGVIHKDAELADVGPYALVRNPLYAGSFFIAAGFAACAGAWWAWAATAAQFVFFYCLTVLSEERFLSQHLGEPYHAYCARVPRFLPRWPAGHRRSRSAIQGKSMGTQTPVGEPAARFSWAQAWRNKEYRSVVPVALLYALFAGLLLARPAGRAVPPPRPARASAAARLP